jgi:hypothetical protein
MSFAFMFSCFICELRVNVKDFSPILPVDITARKGNTEAQLWGNSARQMLSATNRIWEGVLHNGIHKIPNGVLCNLLSLLGRAIAQAVSRWLPTAAVRGSKPDLGMWDLWLDKVALGRFSPSTSVSPCNRRSLHQLLHSHPHISSGENVQ